MLEGNPEEALQPVWTAKGSLFIHSIGNRTELSLPGDMHAAYEL